jgi:pullulanase/glycogen debranching enzyme
MITGSGKMKRWVLIILSVIAYSGFVTGQMIITEPAVPTAGKVIKIFYDSSKDPGDLHNYTSDLYAHTGVFIQGTSGWQKVIGTWGNNSTQPKLTYLGNYRYELSITADIQTFYSLTPADVVTKICLVIRNATASQQTKPDILLDVFKVGLNASFTLPSKSSFVTEIYKNIPVNGSATMADSVSLYINNKFIKSGTSPDMVTYSFLPSEYGEFLVKIIAWDKPAFAVDSFFCYVRRAVTTETLPAGMSDGINYTENNSVTLVLYAPYKKYAFATGDFTNWVANEKGYMKKTPDGERYWLKINGLIPGKEYRFQYLVDTALYIADPYADKILDPANDKYILNDTYPGLIGYPQDTASGIVSVLQTSQIPYSWKSSGYQPPLKSDLIIYELLVRDFTAKHDYKTLIDTLSYLDNLGINAIELMPVNEFEGNISWGYNPSFYFAPDKYYGPKNDLKAFVDSCHNRGIAVIIDMVLNHSFGQSPYVQLYLDYYGTDQIFMKLPNPWFNASSPNPAYKWGADFNHESLQTQKLVDRITAYWLTEYKIDGFRFDFTKGFTNTSGDGSSYNAARIAILKRIADKIRIVNPDAYIILEHFAPNSEEMELADYGMMLWGNNNFNYGEAAMGYPSDLSGVSSAGRGWTVPNLVSYMESHDEERLMYKTITFGSSSADYNTRSTTIALKRMKLASLFFLTVPGPKMIWQFGELGYDVSIDNNGRTGEKPLRWEYYNDTDRHGLFLFYKILTNLRKTQPAFGTDNYSYSLSSPLKRLQLLHSTMNVNILGNFGVTASSIVPAFSQTGKWYEYFTDDSLNVTNVNDPINLLPGEYKLYTTRKLPSPKLIIGIEEYQSPEEKLIVLVFPNPSAGEFTIEIGSRYPGPSLVSIVNLSGRVVRQLNTTISGDGLQIVKWDGRTSDGSVAPSGIYLVNVKMPMGSKTVKIIKN